MFTARAGENSNCEDSVQEIWNSSSNLIRQSMVEGRLSFENEAIASRCSSERTSNDIPIGISSKPRLIGDIAEEADENIDDLKVHAPLVEKIPERVIALGKFPGDFKFPVEWVIDQNTYKVHSIAELRQKFIVLIEGTFRKRCRGLKWREYFGFFLDNGVMIYFRSGMFKKVADFRSSTINKVKGKYSRLNVDGLIVDSKETEWLLEFSDMVKLNLWYQTIIRFCKVESFEVNHLKLPESVNV